MKARTGPRPIGELAGQTAELTRQQRRILEILHGHPGGLSVKQVAESIGLHPNTVRGHMEVLEARGLVNVQTAHGEGPGRPSRLYLAQTSAPGVSLSHMTALIMAGLEAVDPASVAETARQWGRGWAVEMLKEGEIERRSSVIECVTRLTAEMGFAPVANGSSIRLYRCPLLRADGSSEPAICQIHLGFFESLAENLGGSDLDVQLFPHDAPDSCSAHFTAHGNGGSEAGVA